MAIKMIIKIELEKGIWWLNCLKETSHSYPPLTLIKEHAKEFIDKNDAINALEQARKCKPFKNAKIIIFEDSEYYN